MKRPMLPAEWAEYEPIVDAALDAPASERRAIVERMTGGAPDRIAIVEGLLADCERESTLLSRPAAERFAALFDDDAPPPPEMLGGAYRIEREIGRGGMARVYLARDEKHARSVAIKVIRPDLAASLGRERFLREIAIAARLRHPNIVPLFDSGDADGLLYFVMPYEDGPSLRARLQSGTPTTLAERVSILRDIARALAYAHAHGVVHRDVKPDNVMLSGGAAVVTDFGIAKAVSLAQGTSAGGTLTQLGAGIGTPAYMAPEQAVGDPSTDHRADIYSFGCVAYELFTGRPPFHGMPAHGLIASHVGAVAPAVQDISADVPGPIASLITRCLEKNPEARPQSAAVLLEVLEEAPATPRSFGGGARRLFLSRKGRVALVIAVATLAVLMVVTKNKADDTRPGPATTRRLLVLPVRNETGDARLDYIATGIAENVGHRLQQIGGLEVRFATPADWPASEQPAGLAPADTFGGTVLLRMTLARAGDSLAVRASVIDSLTHREKTLAARTFSTLQLRDLESTLAATVSGAVFRVARPIEPRAPGKPVDPESYRLTLEGWHQFLIARNPARAQILFERAVALDGENARAWSGLSSVWGRQTITNVVPFDVGYDRASAAAAEALRIDSLQGTALVNLAIMRAWKHRSLAVAEDLLRQARAAEPSNSEIFQVEGALYRHAWQWDRSLDAMRVAHELDPLRTALIGHAADLLACQDRLDDAHRLLQQEVALHPAGVAAKKLALVLARLKRYDEALAILRRDAQLAGADSLAGVIASLRGEDGYWSLVRQGGRARLAGLRARERSSWASPYHIMLAQFEAGDTEGAYASLARLESESDVNLVKLRCSPEINAERGTPRLESVLARVPGFALR